MDTRRETNHESDSLDNVSEIEIDKRGTFKFVHFVVEDKHNNKKECVHGFARANTHDEIFKDREQFFKSRGFKVRALSGGKMEHDPKSRPPKIKLWGESQAYGKPDFDKIISLIEAQYGDYEVVHEEGDAEGELNDDRKSSDARHSSHAKQ